MTTRASDLTSILENLGVDIHKTHGDEINGRCPVHYKLKGRESTRNSWYINADTGLWHCLAGETLVLTPYGRQPISAMARAGKGWVLDGDGEWQNVEIRSFGQQHVSNVVLSRNGIERVIAATGQHRWYTRYGERTTDQLRVGMRIPSVFHAPVPPESVVREAIQAGFVFGDGHRLSAQGVPYACRAEFFNDHDLEVAAFFDTPVKRSKQHWRIDPLPLSYKDLPWFAQAHTTWLYWWVAGYFAADGSCTPGVKTPTMSSAFREHLEFVYDACVALGIRTSEVRETYRVGITGTHLPLFQLSFYGGLTPEFFLRSDQRAAFESIDKAYERTGWTVKRIDPDVRSAEVFCAVVPSTHSFVLDGNVLTGNCFTCGARGNLAMLVSELADDPGMLWTVQSHLISQGLRRLTAEEAVYEDVLPNVDWGTYAQFDPLPESVLRFRQFDPEVAQRFGVRWDPKEKATVAPIVSQLGELRGWQLKKAGWVNNFPEGVKKHTTLFGVERAFGDTAVLVESPLDVVRFHSVYGNSDISCVSSFGASVSGDQIKLLFNKFDRLIIALDNDHAGELETTRLVKLLPSFRNGIRFWKYDEDDPKDIGEMTDGQVIKGLGNVSRTR